MCPPPAGTPSPSHLHRIQRVGPADQPVLRVSLSARTARTAGETRKLGLTPGTALHKETLQFLNRNTHFYHLKSKISNQKMSIQS